MLKVAIDIDDTITYTNAAFLNYLNVLNNTHINIDQLKDYDYNTISDIFHSSEYYIEQICTFVEYNAGSFKMREHVKDVLTHFKNIGIKFSFFTARQKNMQEETEKWIKNNFDFNVKVYYIKGEETPKEYRGNKGKLANKMGYSILIDDNDLYIRQAIDNNVVPILFNMPWNEKKFLDIPIKRAYDWLQIKEFIVNFNK